MPTAKPYRFTPARRSVAAHHEAGHAIASLYMNVPFKAMELLQPRTVNETHGHVLPKKGRVTSDRQELIILLAGPVAEAKHRRWKVGTVLVYNGLGGDKSDYYRAMKIAEEASTKNNHSTEAILAHFTVEAIRLVEMRWEMIQKVAQALLDRQRLTWDEFLTIV